MDPVTQAQTLRLGFVAFGIAATFGLGLFGAIALRRDRKKQALGAKEKWVWRASLGAAALIIGCFLYGVYVEADWLSVSRHTIETDKLGEGERIRLVHLSDLHVDQDSRALRALPGLVNSLEPDLIVVTGDNVNSELGLPVFRKTMRAMATPLQRVAVMGNHDVWYWSHLDHFGGGVAFELEGSPYEVRGLPLVLCGAKYGSEATLGTCLDRAPAGYRIAAYHTPDLVEDVAGKADLYLGGHTHGGQVRIPGYGAVITMSKFDKKYEMGRYQVGDTVLHVSRGIGFEPSAPRVRFWCRPEVAVIELVGTG